MDTHLINQRLKDIYGVDFLSQPIYRVVWSDSELEKRLSDFVDYLPGTNVLIRKVREVREVKKYSYLEPQYVLEKLFFNQHNDEILDNSTLNPQKCTYEPMWAFGVGKPLVWRAIELIITCINEPKKLTPSEMNDVEFEQARKDEQLMMDLLDANIKNDAFHSSVKDGDTVLLNQDGKKWH